MLPQPSDEVAFALAEGASRGGRASPFPARRPRRSICILGPKGGTGKTLISTNLAVALAERDASVVLVDLDLQFGDVGLALGLSPEQTIFDLVKAGAPLDEEKLDGFLMTHSSGVKVLIAPSRPDQASARLGRVPARGLRDAARRCSTTSIVDTPPGFTPEVIATIDNATDVCMVGMLDALSLKNTKLGLETLDLMGFADRQRQARPQPRRHAGRDHPTTRSSRSSAASPTSSSRATATSRARSTRASRSSLAKPQSGASVAFRSSRRPLREDAGADAGAAAEQRRPASGRCFGRRR